ncbi:MAG: hypothetical protein ACXV3D_07770, partial [Halobacteriota archaeon]
IFVAAVLCLDVLLGVYSINCRSDDLFNALVVLTIISKSLLCSLPHLEEHRSHRYVHELMKIVGHLWRKLFISYQSDD